MERDQLALSLAVPGTRSPCRHQWVRCARAACVPGLMRRRGALKLRDLPQGSPCQAASVAQ
jgi:hypothetical protein